MLKPLRLALFTWVFSMMMWFDRVVASVATVYASWMPSHNEFCTSTSRMVMFVLLAIEIP